MNKSLLRADNLGKTVLLGFIYKWQQNALNDCSIRVYQSLVIFQNIFPMMLALCLMLSVRPIMLKIMLA